MRVTHLFFAVALSLGGCVDDASRAADPGSDVDATIDATAARGTMDAGLDACDEEPAPWWCSPDAEPSDLAVVDAGKPDSGLKPGGGAKPGQGKVSGWYGVMTDENPTYHFTQVSGEEQTCTLSYAINDVVMADDCAACDRAFDGILGDVDVTVDAGGCGDAAERAGTPIAFGHGSMAIEEGTHTLYLRKDAEWSLYPGGTSSLKNGDWTFFHPAADAAPAPPAGDSGLFLQGELDLQTGAGFYRFFANDDDGALRCEFNYPVMDATPNDTCVECAFARDMPISPADRELPGADCQFFGGLSGDTAIYGHTEDGRLFVYKGGTWSDTGGSSGLDGDTWGFTLELNF
jgi:hypothetical protein